MVDEVLVDFLRERIGLENLPNLVVRCFYDNNCDITYCTDQNGCCPFYETKCRLVLDSFFKKVYGVSVMERISSSTN